MVLGTLFSSRPMPLPPYGSGNANGVQELTVIRRGASSFLKSLMIAHAGLLHSAATIDG
jgi:hypothetical protein